MIRNTLSFCSLAVIIIFLTFIRPVTLSGQAYGEETGFYLDFQPTENADVLTVLEFIAEDEELLYDVVDELNDYLDMPVAVPIVFADCGQANAFYVPDDQMVIICYEMLVNTFNLFAAAGLQGEELSIAVANDIFATLYHEVGHALVDILELPITGREEDAVDQFAVVSLLVFDELGQQALIHNALYWALLASQSETDIDNMPFWNEHSLSSQRFYDILCLAYGSDNESLHYLVENGTLPEDRAVRCEDEYIRVANAWDALLNPYVRE